MLIKKKRASELTFIYFYHVNTILHIETATKNCSVALSKNGKQLALVEKFSSEYSHSEQLHGFIQQAFEKANLNLSNLDAVAVSKGPGSYTGLRIGVAAAKGICFALDLPLIGVNSLQVITENYQPLSDEILFPMFDARRMEIYSLVLNDKKEIIRETSAEIITEDTFMDFSKDKTWVLFGSGTEKCKSTIIGEHIKYVDEIQHPSASGMIPLAEKAFKESAFEDIAYFEPFYLKEFFTPPPKKKK